MGLKARPVRADEAAIPPSALYPDMELTRAKSSSLPGYGSRSAQQTEAPKKKKWGWSIFKRSKAPANSSDEDAHKKGGRSKARERPVVDTLTPLQSDPSASQSSLTRKERREAILARAQARRHGPGSAASSSDEERDAQLPSPSPLTRRQHSSQDSLNGRPRSRSARTERFLQRRSRDEESLRREMALEAHPGATDHAHYSEQRRRPNPATPPELGVALRRHQSGSPGGPRAQSLLFGQCKLSTPPPPPPRNPLNRPLNALHGHEHRGRPTSLHAPGPMPALHDYQNVDEHGRLVAPRADNRAAAHHLPLPARVQSVVFPAPAPAPKSPSPFAGVERRPVWLAVKGPASATSPTSPPPLREFWRSRETHQSAPTTPKSARERLAPFQWTSATSSGPVKSPVQPAQHTVGQQQHHVRDLAKLKPSTDRHLEQAICELEQIYQSLHLDGDDELLDRAERRDLPTRHQQPNASGSESEAHQQGGVTSDLDTMLNWSVSGSFESLATGQRRRRSAVPDRIGDDMAVRRLAPRKSVSSDAHSVPAQSYLLVSPSVGDRERQSGGSEESRDSAEPDVVLDDVAFRHMRHAKQSLRVADPQPPFGIPVGPVAPASPSDYLHARVTPEQRELRPLLHPTRYPDLVRDDLAFRNLRKDAGHAQLVAARQLPGPGDADDVVAAAAARGHGSARSKKRAVRSLSANIAQLIKKDAARPSGGGGPVDALGRRSESESESEEDERYVERNPFEAARAQSLSDLLGDLGLTDASVSRAPAKTPRAVKQRSESRRKAADEAEEVAVVRQTRPSPSWVERAKLTDDEERTPALAKLYPASAIWREKRAASEAPRPTEDSTETATQVGHSKPPSGASSGETSGGPTRWEESPLFQCAERPARSRSPADSSDSGQVSCCGREVRQILHEHIRRQEEEQQRPGEDEEEDVEHDDACFSLACAPRLPDDVAHWIVHDHEHDNEHDNEHDRADRAPVEWITSAGGPGSDDGIDSLPATSSSREWSRATTPEERAPDRNNNRVVPPSDERWRAPQSPLKTPGRGSGCSHALRQLVWAGCALASLLALCGLDAATCAHLFLAFLALAAVFCDAH